MKTNLFKNTKDIKKILKVSTATMMSAVMMSTNGNFMAMKPPFKKQRLDSEVQSQVTQPDVSSMISTHICGEQNERLYLDDEFFSRVTLEQVFAWLASHPQITYLLFDGVHFEDHIKGGKFENLLKLNTTLTGLSVQHMDESNSRNDILEVLKNIKDALDENTTLTSLNLSRNNIDSEGAIYLAELLEENTVLTDLSLFDNRIKDDGVISLANALENNPSLTKLTLDWNEITEDGAVALAENLNTTVLANLSLGSNDIRDAGAIALAKVLKESTNLTELDLGGCRIKGTGLSHIASALKVNCSLVKLNLEENTQCLDKARAEALSYAFTLNSTLESLNLRATMMWAEDDVIDILSELSFNNTLAHIDLSDNDLGDEGIEVLSSMLKENSSVTALELRDNCIYEDGAMKLAALLEDNSSIVYMSLGVCDGNDPANIIGNEGAKALAEVLKSNSTLTHLDLSYNGIDDEGKQALAEALKVNSTMTKLCLCEFDDETDEEVDDDMEKTFESEDTDDDNMEETSAAEANME